MPPAPARRAVPFAERAGPILRSSTTMGARLGFTATPAHGNGRGAVHGGMLATLLDEAMGQLVEDVAGVPGATVELGVSFLAGVPADGVVTAEAEITRLGRSLVFAEATVFDSAGQLAARGRGVFKLLR